MPGLPTAAFRVVGQDDAIAAGADAELDEDLAQVPFDRAHGQEQLGADLRVGAAVAGQPGDARDRAASPSAQSVPAGPVIAVSRR